MNGKSQSIRELNAQKQTIQSFSARLVAYIDKGASTLTTEQQRQHNAIGLIDNVKSIVCVWENQTVGELDNQIQALS